jgi:hypothetical protein
LGLPQFLVLRFQFFLVDLEFVDDALELSFVLDRRGC